MAFPKNRGNGRRLRRVCESLMVLLMVSKALLVDGLWPEYPSYQPDNVPIHCPQKYCLNACIDGFSPHHSSKSWLACCNSTGVAAICPPSIGSQAAFPLAAILLASMNHNTHPPWTFRKQRECPLTTRCKGGYGGEGVGDPGRTPPGAHGMLWDAFQQPSQIPNCPVHCTICLCPSTSTQSFQNNIYIHISLYTMIHASFTAHIVTIHSLILSLYNSAFPFASKFCSIT